jgi:hypothetical protein
MHITSYQLGHVLKIVIFLISLTIKSQNIKFFDLIPNELSGDNNAGVLEKVVSDSNGIYFLGHLPRKITGVNNMAHASWGKLDYQGQIKNAKVIIDEDIAQRPYSNGPLIKLNDSIYFTIFQIPNPGSNWLSQSIFKLNIHSGEILQRKLIYDTSKIEIASFVGFSEIKKGKFQLVLIDYTLDPRTSYIFELDTELNILKSLKLPFFNLDLKLCRYISKDNYNNYELILENRYKINGQSTGEAYLSYVKLDYHGNLLKEKKLPLDGNIFLSGADVFTISQDESRSYVIAASDWGPDSLNYQGVPYIFKTTPEFDSVIWITTFYEYPQLLQDPGYIIHYMTNLIDNSGYVVCGEKSTSLWALPDYGILFKVSESGDSLWLRKYQPLGWDSLRAGFFRLAQVNCTPYNTLAVAAYVSDRNLGYIRPWILHVDEHGCLVPGCHLTVNTKNTQVDEVKGLELFPNPVQGSKMYMLSRLASLKEHKILLRDLQSRLIKSANILLTSGMQYIIDLPEDIPNGVYFISVEGPEINQTLKFVVER